MQKSSELEAFDMTSKHSPKGTDKRIRPKPKPEPTHKPISPSCKKFSITIDTDRISTLPDSILHYILSFLPLKQTGRTSILSHRWRYVWASMPGLKFYVDEFEKCGQVNFIRYVNAALPYQLKQDLQVFQTFLFCASPTNRAASIRWINHALKNDVRILHLIIRLKNSGENVVLSKPMLISQSLEELGLFSYPNVKIATPNDINLSQLKKLSLQQVDINSAFVNKIMLGCPRLESLYLHYCSVSCSEISSRALRNLVMELCEIQYQRDNNFYICTPNLVHLYFNQDGVRSSHMEVNGPYCNQFKPDARSLKLDVSNLKSLVLGGYWVATYRDAVPFFLRRTPMLEELTLICIEGPLYWRDVRSVDASSDLRFQCQNLNSVNIIYNVCDERIPHLTEILKRNGVSNLNLQNPRWGNWCFPDDCLKMLNKVWQWINAHN